MAQNSEDESQMDKDIEDLEEQIRKRQAEQKKRDTEMRLKELEEEAEKRMEEQRKKEYEKKISTMEKVGKHYYDDNSRISWEDTFINEQDDIRSKIMDVEIDVEWLWNKSMFIIRMMFFMSKGFFDQGRSFDQGIEILEDEFMLSQIVSPETMEFFQNEKEALMIHWNFDDAYHIAKNHVDERWHHLLRNVQFGDFMYHYVQGMLLIMFTLPGKLSLMSPIFTATTPSLVSADLILIQFVAGWTFFKYYAHGNIMMILTLMWTLSQWFFMYLLVWNNDMYLYDLRLVRYFVYFGAIMFEFVYACIFSAFLELVVLEGKLYKEDNAVEVILALVLGETLIYYFPTALVNFVIIMKEMTLNQFAWRKKDDFQEGMFLNLFSMDVFHWWGFNENINYHWLWLAAWSHYFL